MKPNVLHVLEALETGRARYVTDVVTFVDTVEHHVVVPPERHGGVTDRDAVPAMRAAGATVSTVAMRRSPTHPDNARAVRAVHRLIKEGRPDVVHGHSSIGGVVARAAAAGTGTPVVYTPNAAATGGLATLVERALRPLTTAVVAVSPSERDDLVRRRIASAARLTVIPNGIRPEPPAPRSLRSLLGVDEAATLVGTMGRVSHQKATSTFVAAGAALLRARPDVHLVLIGDGPERAAIEAQVRQAALGDRFHWLRELPGASAYLHDLAVFALPSRFEGLPFAALEAMRAGVPVVLSDAVGNRDVVEHGRSGLLVPFNQPAALTAAIGQVLDDPALAAALRQGAHARVQERFDVKAMAHALGELYASVIRSRGVL